MSKPSPKEPGKKWDRFSIVETLHRAGKTLTGIAKDAGMSESACRRGVLGYNRKGAELVAKHLGVPFREVFPTQYSRGRHNEVETSRTRRPSGSAKPSVGVDTIRVHA